MMEKSSETQRIVEELDTSARQVNREAIAAIIEKIKNHDRIFVYGTGRSGLMLKAFAMRLMQMGFTAYVVGETTTPSVGKGDLLVVASASGETGSVNLTARSARDQGVELLVISAQPDSTLAGIQKPDVLIDAGTKFSHSASSIQPLGSLFEQMLLILFDTIILKMTRQSQTGDKGMAERHASLE